MVRPEHPGGYSSAAQLPCSSCSIRLAISAGPAGLVRAPHAAAIIAVEILVEQDVILEIGID